MDLQVVNIFFLLNSLVDEYNKSYGRQNFHCYFLLIFGILTKLKSCVMSYTMAVLTVYISCSVLLFPNILISVHVFLECFFLSCGPKAFGEK